MRTPTLLAGGLIAVAAAALLGWALLAGESGAAHDPSGARRGGASAERIRTDSEGEGETATRDVDSEDAPGTSPAGPGDPPPTFEGDQAWGDSESASVQVRVVDDHGAPVSGATVEGYPIEPARKRPRYRTGDDGRCELPTSGIYRFSARRYATSVCPVGENGEPEAVVTLLPRRELAGTVLSEGGGPLAGARVNAEAATWYAELTTDADGAFRFVDAPQGEPTVFHVAAKGYVAGAFDEAGLPQLVLSQGATLRGTVVDSRGAPLPGARVRVFTSDRLLDWAETQTDRAGTFTVSGLSETEQLRIEVRGRGEGVLTDWLAWAAELELQASPLGSLVIEGCPTDMVLELQPADPVEPTGHLDEPEHYDLVIEIGRMGALNPATRRGSGPGNVRFPDLIPGLYTLQLGRFQGHGILPTMHSLSIESRETRRAFSTLEPPQDPSRDPPTPAPDDPSQALQVRVVDAQGAPVRWAQVNVTAGSVTAELGTDERGECRFAELPRALVSVSASAPGRVLVAPVAYDPETDSGEQVSVVLATPTVLSGSIGATARPLLRLWPPDQPELEQHFEGTPDGRFRWGGLAPGAYSLEVSADGYVAQELTVELPLTRELQLRLELWRGHDHGHGDEHEKH